MIPALKLSNQCVVFT